MPGGVRVRSRAEYIIATKLEATGIPYEYKPRLPHTDGESKTCFIYPDFHQHEHSLYVENDVFMEKVRAVIGDNDAR